MNQSDARGATSGATRGQGNSRGRSSPQACLVRDPSTGLDLAGRDTIAARLNSMVMLDVDSLVTRAQIGRLSDKELYEHGYIRIRRGVYLRKAAIPETAAPWQIRRLVSQARVLSVALTRRGTPPPIFSLESALAIHGLQTWTNSIDVSYRVEGNKGSHETRTLRSVNAHGVAVSEVKERQLVSAMPQFQTVPINGVLTAPLGIVAVDCARYLHPLAAVVAVSSVLAHASEFDRWSLESSREKEARAKDVIRRQMTCIVGRRGSRQAAAVVDIADAGLQTPGEAYVWWLLQCMLPEAACDELVTQSPVELEGRMYFPDAALPGRKVSFEFDGFAKIPENEREFLSRQRAFLGAGWIPIRVDQKQLDNLDVLIAYLLRELRGTGIAAHYPRGPLWKPLTRELLDPRRRF